MNLRTRVKIFMSKFKGELLDEDARELIQIIETPESGTYQMNCGAQIVTNRRKSNEESIRATVMCDRCCAGSNCRGISTTVAGALMIQCSTTNPVVQIIVQWNDKQRQKLRPKEKKHE